MSALAIVMGILAFTDSLQWCILRDHKDGKSEVILFLEAILAFPIFLYLINRPLIDYTCGNVVSYRKAPSPRDYDGWQTES